MKPKLDSSGRLSEAGKGKFGDSGCCIQSMQEGVRGGCDILSHCADDDEIDMFGNGMSRVR